jgi:hypothetical protein
MTITARKRGRKPLSPLGKRKVVSVRLPPEGVIWLGERYGSVAVGIRTLVRQAMTASDAGSDPLTTDLRKSEPETPPAAGSKGKAGMCERCRRLGVPSCESCRKLTGQA